MNIIVSNEIESVCPQFAGAAVEALVVNTPRSEGLWAEIDALCENYKQQFDTTSIKQLPGVEATRRVYRACGKDPSRYRPSSEALIRRVVQGKNLYQIDTLVDLINLALGVGKKDEPYEGIGRGILNIEGMHVYRDSKGGVGTPTSDNERTKIELSTTHLFVIVNGYDGNRETVNANARYIKDLLERFAEGKDIQIIEF